MQKITARELHQRMEENDALPVVNVLPEERYRVRHIPGSISIPLGDDDFLHRVETVAKDKAKPLVVYCADRACNASPTAAKRLEQAGYTHVLDFEAGMQGWEDAGLPTVAGVRS